jgi:hypothetical protein
VSVEPITTGAPARAPHPRTRPATRPGAGPSRSRLSLVPAPRRAAPRTPFVLIIVGLLGLGLLVLLLLNTASAQDAFRLSDLQRQSKSLADQQQSLTRSAEALGDPASLAAAAQRLGMVPGGPPTFLQPGQKVPAGQVIDGMVVVPGAAAPSPPQAASAPTTSTPTKSPATPKSTTGGTRGLTAAQKHLIQQNAAAFQRMARAQAAADAARKAGTGKPAATATTGAKR